MPEGKAEVETKADAEPNAKTEQTVTWEAAVVILNSDVGDGTIRAFTEAQLVALGQLPSVAIIDREKNRPGTSSDAESARPNSAAGSGTGSADGSLLVTVADAVGNLQQQMAADEEAGKAAKLEALQVVASPELESDAEAETEPEPSSETAAPDTPRPDVIYVLVGFVLSVADAENLLDSAISIDAVINIRLPHESNFIPNPTEEEIEATIETTKEYVSSVLVPILTELNSETESGIDYDYIYEKLELYFSVPIECEELAATRARLPEETVAAYDMQKFNAVKLAEAIADAIPQDDEEDLIAGSGEDAAVQMQTIFAAVLDAAATGLASFVVAPEPEPEPEPIEAIAITHMRAYASDVLPAESWRNGIAWLLLPMEYEPLPPELDENGDPVPVEEPAAEEILTNEERLAAFEAAANARSTCFSRSISKIVPEFATKKFAVRKQYMDYIETLEIIPVAAADESISLTYYHKILDAYEAETTVGVLHVIYCLVEQLAEGSPAAQTAPAAECEKDSAQTITSFLAGAMASIGAAAIHKTATGNGSAHVESKMTEMLPLPGRYRAGIPSVPSLTPSERMAEAASLYPFVRLRWNKIERALLRDSIREMIVANEPKTSAGGEASHATWDEHLSARTHIETLTPAAMATNYQAAVSVLSPASTVMQSYCSRHDRMLLALHTPAPPPARVGTRTKIPIGIPGIPALETWENGVQPPTAYTVNYSRTEISVEQQTLYPMDSACLVTTTGLHGERRVSVYASDSIFGSASGSGLFTATLADGSTVSVEAGRPFCTLTITDRDGQTIRLHGSGSVDVMRANTSSVAKIKGMAKDICSSVVSKGSLVRKYDDGGIRILYRTGDVSVYDPCKKAWTDTNEGGARQKRVTGVEYTEAKKPEVLAAVSVARYVDHETNANVVARADRVRKNYHDDGSVEVEHADGVKILSTPGSVAVAMPDCNVDVTVASSHTEIAMPDSGRIKLTWPTLALSWGGLKPSSYPSQKVAEPTDELTKWRHQGLAPTLVLKEFEKLDSKSTIVVTRPDGTVITVRDNVVTVALIFPGTCTYTFNLNDDTARAVDAASNAFMVADDGEVTSSLARTEDAPTALTCQSEATPSTIESHVPRLFVVDPDGSGFEWHIQDRALYWLSTCGDKLMSKPVPGEDSGSMTYTVAGNARTMETHPRLREDERLMLTEGLERFAGWAAQENAEAEALVPVERRGAEEIAAEAEVQAKAEFEMDDAALCKKMVDQYNATSEVIESAEEYYRKFDMNSDGVLTAEEMIAQLAEWGVTQPLEDYIGRGSGVGASAITVDQVITKGEWYSFFFPVIEMLPLTEDPKEAEATRQSQAVIDKYGASAMLVESADEYFRNFDLNGDGVLTVDEMRTQLLDWGIQNPLEDYIARQDAVEIVADEIITHAEWYSFYFPVIEMLQPVAGAGAKAVIPAPKPGITAAPEPAVASQQSFLVHPQKIDFGRLIQGCTYRQPLSMTNVSAQPCKFKIRLPKNNDVRVVASVGAGTAVQVGATCMLEVEITAQQVGNVHEPIEIIADDTMVFRLEVAASVKFPPKVDFYPYGTGRRVAVPKDSTMASNLRGKISSASISAA